MSRAVKKKKGIIVSEEIPIPSETDIFHSVENETYIKQTTTAGKKILHRLPNVKKRNVKRTPFAVYFDRSVTVI